ncbi:hypothetical protein HDU97_004665 [Phlyctochytrium planicorne]|nr:hypothetical protein HDU97_004665 [Phlyctochytrium planicorne]
MPPKRKSTGAPSPTAKKAATESAVQQTLFGGTSTKIEWSVDGTVLVGKHKTHDPSLTKVAAFDFDDTVVTPNGTHKFSKGPDDWKLYVPAVKSKIIELAKTHVIIIISNQKGLLDEDKKKKGDHTKAQIFKGKVQHFVDAVGVPVTIFAAVEDDYWRKPRVGMWDVALNTLFPDGSAAQVDLAESFYCGDAAGRGPTGGKKKDHADTDYKFAKNCGLKFLLPEELFEGDMDAAMHIPDFDFNPQKLLESSDDLPLFTPTNTPLVSPAGTQDLVILVGAPGAGKTYFSYKHLVPHGYHHINMDKMKTKDKCVREAKSAFSQGKNVVVDNTNPDPKARSEFIAIAKDAKKNASKKVTLRAFHFEASVELAQHNARYRAMTATGRHAREDAASDGDGNGVRRERIPDIAYNTFKSRYTPPEMSEGFDEIKKIRFVADFESEAEKERWALWH